MPPDLKTQCFQEIMATERCYLDDLEIIVLDYARSSPFSEKENRILFRNASSLLHLHRALNESFLQDQQEVIGVDDLIERTMSRWHRRMGQMDFYRAYLTYCLYQDEANALMKQMRSSRQWSQLQEVTAKESFLRHGRDAVLKRNLEDFLIYPIQRLCRYPLLLQRLSMALEPDHRCRASVEMAYRSARSLAERVDRARLLTDRKWWHWQLAPPLVLPSGEDQSKGLVGGRRWSIKLRQVIVDV